MKQSKFDKILESFAPIRTSSRLFYPRKFALSEDFIKAFKIEHARLSKEGENPKTLIDRIMKASRFHL